MTPFRWPLRVQFVDTDASGRIHYTAMLRHFEAAEVEFFRHLGISYNHLEFHASEISLPRVHVEADYLAGIFYDDLIEIEVSIERVGQKSYTLAFQVFRHHQLAGRGRIVVACMDRSTLRSRPLPDDLRQKLLAQ